MKDKADLTIQCTFSNKTTFTNTFDTKGNGATKKIHVPISHTLQRDVDSVCTNNSKGTYT